jgi:hypothetical protein
MKTRKEIWTERNVMKERYISRQNRTLRERGGGNYVGIKIYICHTNNIVSMQKT